MSNIKPKAEAKDVMDDLIKSVADLNEQVKKLSVVASNLVNLIATLTPLTTVPGAPCVPDPTWPVRSASAIQDLSKITSSLASITGELDKVKSTNDNTVKYEES